MPRKSAKLLNFGATINYINYLHIYPFIFNGSVYPEKAEGSKGLIKWMIIAIRGLF
jgi:hypothetical protein